MGLIGVRRGRTGDAIQRRPRNGRTRRLPTIRQRWRQRSVEHI